MHRGRRWIVASDAAAGTTRVVERLRDDGASAVMVVAGIEGVGDLPAADRFHYTRTRGATLMDGIRAFLRSVEEPSDALLEAVDGFDPDGDALVLGQGFSRLGHLAGRPVYGRRPRAWRDLEDKTTVDALWDEAGVARAPHAVVPVSTAAAEARRIAGDDGTVWVADNRTGWHGGGEYTRWAAPGADLDELAAWFTDRAEVVRIMPFLEGIPCSIHGFATGDGVAVFAPLELFILRRRDPPGFVYSQGASFWSPPEAIVTDMRRMARQVGDHLRGRYDYRGGFGIDGVATIEGFRPTELNPRMTLGHMIFGTAAEVPLGPAERLLLEGDLDIDARELEDRVMAVAEDRRGGGMAFFPHEEHEPDEVLVSFEEGGVAIVDDEDRATARMTIGPAAAGSFIKVTLDEHAVPIGPSLAPQAAQLMALARTHWDLDLPDVTAAPDPFGTR